MARGLPAVLSTVAGLPFLATGAHLALGGTEYPTSTGIPVLLFGGFGLAVGLYVQFIAAPERPTIREGEEIVDTRNPAQRAAIAKAIVGFLFLVAAGYLLFFTFTPYVYPRAALFGGLYSSRRGCAPTGRTR